jgi:hypothetical protein
MATVGTETVRGRFFPRLHWSAILAGVLLALAVHIVMGLIGAAIGFAAAPADSEALGAGAGIWALITPFVATLLGAWLAVRLTGDEDRAGANVHGILVWCAGLIAGALFLTGTLATGAMSAGTAASGNLAAAQRTVQGEPAGAPAGTAAAEAREDAAGKAGAAAMGAAALAAIAGLLGAVIGSGLALRRASGKGRSWGSGWRIAIHREERREGVHLGERGIGSEVGSHGMPPPGRVPTAGEGTRRDLGPTEDPYHH